MLEVSNLSVVYDAVSVLKNVSVLLEPGTFTALVGPNGTGKSSLLKSIAGLIAATGEIRLNGSGALTGRHRLDAIAYMPQDSGVASSLTVMEVILLGRLQSLGLCVSEGLHDDAVRALSRFNLSEYQSRTLSELSGGQRQMVYLAQSLFRDPAVLLLDEPTASLDLRHQLVVLDRVVRHCRDNNTIGMSAMHDLSLAARFADRIIFLAEGVIAADGKPAEVVTASLLREVYGVETEVVTCADGSIHILPIRALGVC